MKSVNVKISDEAYKILFNYKIDHNLKTLEEALESILLLMKGGLKK